jgi:nucleoside phosphorylase
MVVLCLRLSDEVRAKNASLADSLHEAAIRIAMDAQLAGSRAHGDATVAVIDVLSSVWPLLSLAVIPEDQSLPARLGKLLRAQTVRIGIVTALPKEFAAMRMMLEEEALNPVAGDPNDYIIGTIPTLDGSGCHTVVLTLLKEMGNNSAAAAATHLLRSFPTIRDVLMVGIAGGIPVPESPQQHVRLGDVAVSDKDGLVQYDNVKFGVEKTTVRSATSKPSARMIGAIKLLESERLMKRYPWEDFIERAVGLEGAGRPPDDTDRLHSAGGRTLVHPEDPVRRTGRPKLHYGRIGTSNVLLKNPEFRDQLRKDHGIIAVEMEASGVADATWSAGQEYVVIRGICDYCDEHKSDLWQGYAAVAAAAYARALVSAVSLGFYSDGK